MKNIYVFWIINLVSFISIIYASKEHVHSKQFRRQPDVVLKIKNGLIRGETRTTPGKHMAYYSFRGIPYAKPPIGDLRFKKPQQPPDWKNVLNATKDGNVCPQIGYKNEFVGSEDCLFINVYTTTILKTASLPVMVWVHGGGFTRGDGTYSFYAPDYFLEENVIVVTLNYRLGILGFLSTEDSVSPGNYGLKDQIFALKWVRDNIRSFGGDPKNVTIFGESAGAASVHYLAQTPLAKGLFSKVILESGYTLSLFSLARHPKFVANAVAKNLGVFTTNSKTLVDELRKVDYKTLTIVSNTTRTILELVLVPFQESVFGPSFEPPSAEAVVTAKSYEILQNGKFHRVPFIIGFNSLEGQYFSSALEAAKPYLIAYDVIPAKLVPIDMNIPKFSLDEKYVAMLIKTYYFGTSSVAEAELPLIKYLSDNQFVRPARQSVILQSGYSPTYFYRFSYEGDASRVFRKYPGVGHAEELIYMFNNIMNLTVTTQRDIKTRNRLIKLWTNFAKVGNPTPTQESILQNVIWPTVPFNGTNITYLDIGENLAINSNPHGNDMAFWDLIYKSYGRPPYDTY